MDKIVIPISRFRREMRKWIRFIKNNPDEVIYMSTNGFIISVFISPKLYDSLVDDVNHAISKDIKNEP